MDASSLKSALDRLTHDAKRKREEAEHLARAARELAAAGRFSDATALLTDLVADHPADAGLRLALAEALEAEGHAGRAFAQLVDGLRYTPGDVATHQRIGRLLREGVGDEASYLDAVWPERPAGCALAGIGPGGPDEVEPLVRAQLLVALQAFDAAADAYGEAARQGNERAGPYREEVLRMAGRPYVAAEEEGARLAAAGDSRAAARAYRTALEAEAPRASAYAGYARMLSALHASEAAIAACRDGLRLFPGDPSLERTWLWTLVRDGRLAEATARAAAFAERGSVHGSLDRVRHLSLPVLYADEAEAEAARASYEEGLANLDAAVWPRAKAEAERWAGLLRATNFFLAYQGLDDRALQERYAAIAGRIISKLLPVPISPAAQPLAGRRIRVGYASAYWSRHTVGKLFAGWLRHHNTNRFEVFAYQLGGPSDVLTDVVRASADTFRRLPVHTFVDGYAEAASQIAADALDVLVYPSIGMHPASFALGSLRLAPVQAVAWGHPVTTGLPTIDYFLSSDLMEPEGAAEHYSERLVRLPGLGVAVEPPAPPAPRHARAHFGLAAGDVVYLSPQSLFKYHPRYDALYPAIARLVPNAVFVFIVDSSEHVTRAFIARLERAFEAAGLDPLRHLAFRPRLSRAEFFDLNHHADVYLDSPGWSGGMTTLEALATGLPAVTWPGPFMRARHTYAFLRALDLPSLIAYDLDEYVEIAVRLGNDPDERTVLRRTILERAGRLYDDTASVRALEAFFERAVAECGDR